MLKFIPQNGVFVWIFDIILRMSIKNTPWIFPEERAGIISRLLEWGLIKFDYERRLPLKNGGKTDIYINLRNARDNPRAISFISDLYKIPLNHLNINRFVEVPDSVSCFAGPLAIKTGTPYLTIREQPKEGRLSDARIIGHAVRGESVCIIDDVITNGDSKIVPHQQCLKLGLQNRGLVVLVDRQQGWQSYLKERGIDLPVWAGMTLHNIRRNLIETGIMKRSDKAVEARNPLIVSLDGMNWNQILPFVECIRTSGCILKVNDLFFEEGLRNLLPNLSVYGRIMVDLKWHDIPNTVGNICRHLLAYPPWAVTVHSSGGKEMIAVACKELRDVETKVLAVTLLTSIDSKTCEEIYHRQPMEQVLELAEIATEAGVDGLVCSAEEVGELRRKFPKLLLVTPGIRSFGIDAGDQKRISTPRDATSRGADYLVMGRQIYNAGDPIEEVNRILKDELGIYLNNM